MYVKRKYLKNSSIPLPLTALLIADDYDYKEGNYLSATDLLRPSQELVLRSQVKVQTLNLVDSISATIGSAIHKAYEDAMNNPDVVREAMEVCGINPKIYDALDIRQEQRLEKEYLGFTIGGKFDLCIDGELRDLKTMNPYSYKLSTPDKFIKQASIYRWLDPDLIQGPTFDIDYIIIGWNAMEAARDKLYPQAPVFSRSYEFMSLGDTERFIASKINSLKEVHLTCSDEELWMAPSVYKIYKDPSNPTRSIANSNTFSEASVKAMEKGYSDSHIVEVKGKAKACKYCSVKSVCPQYKSLSARGLIDA